MSKIILKKSSVTDKTPVVGDLEYGELAINYADGKLFYKKSDNTIQQLNSATFSGGTVTGAVNITNNTTSSSTTTGALTVTGGVGVGGSIYAPNYYLSGGSSLSTASIVFVIDGGGNAITTGIKGDIAIPFNCTINSWRLLADVSGSIVVDIWEDSYANFPPTVADTITGTSLPTITSSTKNESSTLTGWTTTLTSGDILRFNVNSVSTITRVTLSLQVTKT